MTIPMRWEDAGDTAVRCSPWTICSIRMGGREVFELWHDKQPARVGEFATAKLAAQEAKRMEEEGRG